MRNTTTQSWRTAPVKTIQPTDWLSLATILALAIVLRLLFYTGFFGSDEVTYVETAVGITSGDWHASNYIGATRYGMNLPVALFIYLFGLSEASANLWPFLCSIGEVAIVFVVARRLWGLRVAVISATLLALLPLHVHYAGRMMADPPLAFFLSLSVLLLLHAVHAKHSLSYIAAGLAWGAVFWVKESVALLYLPVFLSLSLVLNRFDGRGLWILFGMAIALLGNCVLMNFVSGNPLHVFAVMSKALATVNSMATLDTSPWYYFRYFFMDIRHTFLLGFLVAAGIALYVRYFVRDNQAAPQAQFVILWIFLLVGMFSFALVSFSPVQLVMKQTNYMLIFAAPLALLAGWFLASLPRQVFVPLSILILSGSVILAALEQQAVTVFTANSKAAYIFLRDHPKTYLVATINNVRAINFFSMMENRQKIRERVMSFSDMAEIESVNAIDSLATKTREKDIYALLDLESIFWGSKTNGIRNRSDVPTCWQSMGPLTPAALGNGSWVTQSLLIAGAVLPESLQQPYMAILQPLTAPKTAHLFKVSKSCLTRLLR